MTKNSYQKPSQQTQEEALKIARGTQRPAQTKEQTRLIAQGIQKGIDLYKKQQKEKARDLNRKLKKISSQKEQWIESDVKYKRVSFIDSTGFPGCYCF